MPLAAGAAFVPMMADRGSRSPRSARGSPSGWARSGCSPSAGSSYVGLRGIPRGHPGFDAGRGAGRGDDPGRAGRSHGHAARDDSGAERRARTPGGHGERGVQHEPPGRRRPRGRGVRGAARAPGDVPAWACGSACCWSRRSRSRRPGRRPCCCGRAGTRPRAARSPIVPEVSWTTAERRCNGPRARHARPDDLARRAPPITGRCSADMSTTSMSRASADEALRRLLDQRIAVLDGAGHGDAERRARPG